MNSYQMVLHRPVETARHFRLFTYGSQTRTDQRQPARPLTGTNARPGLSELTPRLYLLTRCGDYLRLLVDCMLGFSRSARGGTSSRGCTRSPRAERSVKQMAFAGHNPFAIG